MRAWNQVLGGSSTLLRSGEGRVRLRQTLTGHPLAGSRLCPSVHIRQHAAAAGVSQYRVYSR
jgi:hypothetical protein